ncbi:MAG: TRAP transporter substrate-binding protein DctP [Bacteriovoracaceae bacterium]|nr:TRAP transporter substrate-binding protein DctP [Bacteriovoracaceae bacterium]
MKITCAVIFFLTMTSSFAGRIKVGVLAPEGTNWAKHMKEMGKEIKTKTNGDVSFKFYFGGAQGDEVDVLRKVRINQLQGGIFTGKTLGDIHGDTRVVEIPFVFGGDRGKAWNSVQKLTPFFNKGLEAEGFKNLGFFEIGLVYFVSQKKTENLAALKGVKIWSWEGDKIVEAMIEKMKLVSVPLPLPDVLSSLSTGIIEAAYAPAMPIIALQWSSKVKYLVDFPIAFSLGSFLISKKAWSSISAANQKIVAEVAKVYMAKVNESNIADNVEALNAIKANGVEFIKFPKADEETAKTLKQEIMTKLKGKLFSEEALKKLNSSL